ncbi:hypothetical protein GGI20_001421 [Coemansia sp. BCRC 34301]|nr:hypothetical protein GGI20_001421 [Coemansia sp. BCRC 34301]
MRGSTASRNESSPMQTTHVEADRGSTPLTDHSTSVATSTAATLAVDPGSGPGGGGNNTRSFRFLLTLALRKAQTAVTLDNGGHVEEAIRTYREAISMLGLVLSRTNEEDGRQRLLHFRQTYSDRVSVLSSLRPPATEPHSGANAHSATTKQAHDSATNLQVANSTENQDAVIRSRDAPPIAGDQPDGARHHAPSSAAASPLSIPERTLERPPRIITSGSSVMGKRRGSESSSAAGSPTTWRSSPSRDTPTLSPVILNKPLPPLVTGENSPPKIAHKPSMASLVSSTQSDLHQSSLKSAHEDEVDDDELVVAAHKSGAASSAIPAASHLTENGTEQGRSAKRSADPKADKRKAKDDEKTNRRQSIKNQRSLPAMFGIGLKSKAEPKHAPPVPQLPAATENANGSNLGRRLFGALRGSTSGGSESQASKPPVAASDAGNPPARSSARRNTNMSTESGVMADSLLQSDPLSDSQPATRDVSRTPSGSASANMAALAAATDEDIIMIEARLNGVAGRASVELDAVPPTQVKDSPPAPSKPASVLTNVSSTQTLTREQKRQSNAAHRLAGLFKRKPSIPDIPASGTQAYPKLGLESSKYGGQGHQQQPMPVSAAHHILPKDRRLSTSASTPNLIEAAAAAANSDQPALAVYAATERGDIPPMPTPPTLRPSISSATSTANPAVEFAAESSFGESKQSDLHRKSRGDSFNEAALSGNTSLLRIDERRLMRQAQQPHATVRPPLKIATRSAADVSLFVPESLTLPNAPMTASVDGGASRSRKSSIAAPSGSQSIMARAGNSSSTAALASGSSSTLSGQASYGRPTLVDIEEDQRLEMFEPHFGTFHRDIGAAPPKSSPLSSLWFIATLHRSMVSSGAHLTPSLFIPRRLWYQAGIRIAAIDTKLSVLAQLTQSFASVNALVSLPEIDALLSPPAHSNGKLEEGERRRAEAAPWESEDARGRVGSYERDAFHKSCVALHHWLNKLEESLDGNRRLLAKKLKFVNPSSTATGSANGSGTAALLPSSLSILTAPAAISSDSLHASVTHLPSFVAAAGSPESSQLTNTSFPSLSLSNGDIHGSNQLVSLSPLSPAAELPELSRVSDARLNDVGGSIAIGSGIANGALTPNASKDQLSKDQMANARFKGLGKLGKSVDRLYSNIQKEKLDDTSAYVAALQRMFEAAMVLETLLHYFSRVASDADMAGWFTDVPQSPVALAGKRPQLSRGNGPDAGSRGAASSSPLATQAVLASEPSASSIGSVAAQSMTGRKSSNASISAIGASADKKNRRRSNYFGQRQNSASGPVDSTDNIPGMVISRATSKPRSESFSVVPRLVPAVPSAGAASSVHNFSGGRFVVPQSPIKNPMGYVQQGKGRAPGVLYARLVKVAEWLNQVLLAWVVRDLQVLFAKYIKRLREWVIE